MTMSRWIHRLIGVFLVIPLAGAPELLAALNGQQPDAGVQQAGGQQVAQLPDTPSVSLAQARAADPVPPTDSQAQPANTQPNASAPSAPAQEDSRPQANPLPAQNSQQPPDPTPAQNTPQNAARIAALRRDPVVIRGGWLFTATSDNVVRNQGILIVAGRLLAVNRPITADELATTTVYRIRIDRWSGKQKVAPADFPGAFRYGEPPAVPTRTPEGA